MMSPAAAYILVAIALLCLTPLLRIELPWPLFAGLIAGATFQDHRVWVDLPTPIFWILVVGLLFCLRLTSLGTVLFYALLFPYVKSRLGLPDVPTTGWLTFASGLFWIVWMLYWPAVFFVLQPTSLSCIFCWIVITIVMRDKIHFFMSPGYWFGWGLLFTDIQYSLPPGALPSWNIVCVSLILGSGILIRADISGVRFFLWALFCLVATTVVQKLFLFVWLYPEKYLFPFNMISGYYKIRPGRKWYPLGLDPDAQESLCGPCKRITVGRSKLILGSYWPLIRLVEWHKP